jgi:eukaryotic-like serine/threonine-protein kinase
MLTGQKVGPFVIEKEVGSGAMGTVYRGTHTPTGQKVAVKFMSPSLGGNERSMARFEREVAILKQLKHPNIVRCFGASKHQGMPYYAMEYVEGESLDHVMERRVRITWEELVTLGQQLCDALHHAHQQGIIHRDLKPSNVMVLRDGTVKLTDFGIAKDLDVTQLTSANCTVGTAAYMSPEQCRGERDLTHKSDLYSLGVMFYELLLGRKPFTAENAMDMFLMHCNGTFERPSRIVLDIPVWLDTLVCQMMEKKPELRPRDAEMVSQVLGSIAEKVAAQQSAGVDAVRKRIADRQPGQAKLGEEDKETARLLLTGKFKVKRRKKVKPLTQRKWFQALCLSGLLVLAIGGLIWGVMPPGADKVYARFDAAAAGFQADNYEDARKHGQDFLTRFPDDPRAESVRERLDQFEEEQLRNQFASRVHLRRNLHDEPEAKTMSEKLAYLAIRAEDFGDPYLARDRWRGALEHATEDEKLLSRLASHKALELTEKTKDETPETEREKQLAFVKQRLEEALQLKTQDSAAHPGDLRKADLLFEDISKLYKDHPDENLVKLAKDAANIQKIEPEKDKKP